MSGRVFVDTNVFVYVFDEDAPQKRERAKDVIQELTRDGRIVLSTQVLQEFYVSVTRKFARVLPPEEALETVRRLASLPVVQIDGDTVIAAIRLSQAHQLSLWDALVLRAAAIAGCSTVLTEDLQTGRQFGGVEVVNPFTDLEP
jgi:predicted nucleic acid-binding protein